MPGLDKLLRGVLRYRASIQPSMVKDFQRIKDNPQPKAVMISCVDSRIIITRLLQSQVGDMLLVRNAGNVAPDKSIVSTEAAALQLGCLQNGIRHVVVCGHSDCKAMGVLFSNRQLVKDVHCPTSLDAIVASASDIESDSCCAPPTDAMRRWLFLHGADTINAYDRLLNSKNCEIKIGSEKLQFDAIIDKEGALQDVDKFSQINTLVQMEKISQYDFLYDKIRTNKIKLNAFWFDVYSGDFFMFSKERKKFILVTNDSYNHLVYDSENYKRPFNT